VGDGNAIVLGFRYGGGYGIELLVEVI